MTNTISKSKVIGRGEGEKLSAPGISCTFKITGQDSGNTIGVYELVIKPRQPGAQLHFHKFITETFIIIRGELTMQVGNEIIQVNEGSICHIPPLVNHSFYNSSDAEVQVLLIFNPAMDRENFFRELYKNLADQRNTDLPEANREYDTYFITTGYFPQQNR